MPGCNGVSSYVAVTADQLFHTALTGVQHYTDSLLCGLANADSDLSISAFAPSLTWPYAFDQATADGALLWSRGMRLDRAGAEFALAGLPMLRSGLLRSVAERADMRVLKPVHWRT